MKHDWFLLYCAAALAFAALASAIVPQALRAPGAHNLFTQYVAPPQIFSALFVGDVMLDRTVATHAQTVGDARLFAGVSQLFQGHDAVIGNLEGAITDNASISIASTSILRFTFDPHFASVLKNAGFTVLGSANNHALDFGESGYITTVEYLRGAGLLQFGSPLNSQNLSTSITANGKTLCLVGYMQLFNPDPTSVLAEIANTRPMCSYEVVFAHWGVEYQHEPTQAQRDLAHQFIDAGVDAVIGAHPHVVEPLEIYKNKAIFYSLGNFIFDQSFSEQVKRGLAVEVDFENTKTQFKLTPVYTVKEVSVAGATTTKAVLNDVVDPDLDPAIANAILTTGFFELAK